MNNDFTSFKPAMFFICVLIAGIFSSETSLGGGITGYPLEGMQHFFCQFAFEVFQPSPAAEISIQHMSPASMSYVEKINSFFF